MSVEAFDLGQRLRAAATGQPSQYARYAPVLPPTGPVAITLTGSGSATVLRVSTSSATATGHGHRALEALAALDVGLGEFHRTLVVADRASLSALAALARSAARADRTPEQAAVIGWWEQRADHPGTGAVLVLADVCRLRWRLGVIPEHERDISTWRSWLNVTDPGPCGLRELASLVSGGHTLPGLLDMHTADTRSWEYHRTRALAGHIWHRPDSRTEAALGLATRSDAAELYNSLRLGDPLVALRASFTGDVVTGTVTALQRGQLELRTQRLICRLRPDSRVQGWSGGPQDAPLSPEDPHTRLSSGHLTAVTIAPDKRLVLTVHDTIVRPGQLSVGDTLTLRPRAVDPRQQRNGRQLTSERYQAHRNWLAGRAPAPRVRRDVPLDVVISAAED